MKRDQFFKSNLGIRGGEKENAKFIGVMQCFHFSLLTINYHGN